MKKNKIDFVKSVNQNDNITTTMPAFNFYMSPFYKKIMSAEERQKLTKMIIETDFDIKQIHHKEKKFQRWLTPDDIIFVFDYIEEHFEEKVFDLKNDLVKYFDKDDNSFNQLYEIIKEAYFCEGLPSVYNPDAD